MVGLSTPVAMALVALIGYLVGRRGKAEQNELMQRSHRELRRAQMVAAELERIACEVRQSLRKHHASLDRFKDRVGKLNQDEKSAAWQNLCQEAEDMLKPTLNLASQIADAYEQIRQQSAHLMTFTETRTDPLTGVKNRRALDDILATQFAMVNRYGLRFSVALFDIDHFKQVNDEFGHLRGDQILREVAKLFDETVRETDVVARFGGEEFVIVMPQTDLTGALLVAERVRQAIQQQTIVTVSGGLAAALEGDNAESLLARADACLYSAKTAGRNCIHRHRGDLVEAAVDPQEQEATHAT